MNDDTPLIKLGFRYDFNKDFFYLNSQVFIYIAGRDWDRQKTNREKKDLIISRLESMRLTIHEEIDNKIKEVEAMLHD